MKRKVLFMQAMWLSEICSGPVLITSCKLRYLINCITFYKHLVCLVYFISIIKTLHGSLVLLYIHNSLPMKLHYYTIASDIATVPNCEGLVGSPSFNLLIFPPIFNLWLMLQFPVILYSLFWPYFLYDWQFIVHISVKPIQIIMDSDYIFKKLNWWLMCLATLTGLNKVECRLVSL